MPTELHALAAAVLAGAAVLSRPRRRRPLVHGGADLDPPGSRGPLAPLRSASGRRRWLSRPRGVGPAAATTRAEALVLIDDVAGQVRAGASPAAAWSEARALMTGSSATGAEEPIESLRQLAAAPGAPPGLRALHASWILCDDVGAPLADVLKAVAAGIRQDAEVEADIDAALAGPQATARLLAGLPLVGLAIGELIGARPLEVLVQTPVGRTCGVLGLLLAGAGQWWTRRLIRRTAALL